MISDRHRMSAVAQASPVTGATSVGKDEHHERIVLEPSPLQTKEIEEAKGRLFSILFLTSRYTPRGLHLLKGGEWA